MQYALVLFIAIPIIEIALLLRVGDAMGWIPTLLIVIATAIVGSAMLRQQGLATMDTARQRMDAGQMPAQQLVEGLFIMIGGVLLLTPGFVTDTFGFLCLIPPTRRWLAARMSARVMVGMSANRGGISPDGSVGSAGAASHTRPQGSANQDQHANKGDIIDGDFKRLDDD